MEVEKVLLRENLMYQI